MVGVYRGKPLPSTLARKAVPVDVEPLRFLYHGLRETEPESACLHFYRILEFYAFFEIQQDVAVLRADTSLNDQMFLSEVRKLVPQKERPSIVRLVTKLTGKRLLSKAVREGLIAQPKGAKLGDALYDFRNSFVHAKYDQRTSIFFCIGVRRGPDRHRVAIRLRTARAEGDRKAVGSPS